MNMLTQRNVMMVDEIMEEHRAGEQRVLVEAGIRPASSARPASVVLAAGGNPFRVEGQIAVQQVEDLVNELEADPRRTAVRFIELQRRVEELEAAAPVKCPRCGKRTLDAVTCERCDEDVCAACIAEGDQFAVYSCVACTKKREEDGGIR